MKAECLKPGFDLSDHSSDDIIVEKGLMKVTMN